MLWPFCQQLDIYYREKEAKRDGVACIRRTAGKRRRWTQGHRVKDGRVVAGICGEEYGNEEERKAGRGEAGRGEEERGTDAQPGSLV